MNLIKPKHLYKNVKSAEAVSLNLLELGITSVVLVVDSNINNYMIKEIIKSLQADLNVILIFGYEGGEPQTVELDIFLTNISKYDFNAIIGVGGGSTLDFTKAASVLHKKDVIVDSSIYQGVDFEITTKVTCVCIPTTAGSGAEATKSAVMFNPTTNVKRGINNLKILPDIVFLVPAILDNLPGKVFYPSLFDGVTHAFESLIGKSSTKETSILAKKSLLIYRKQLNINYSNEKYHKKVLEASFYAGQAICNSETGPIHALSYPISEYLKLSHGQAISLILPKIVLFYNDINTKLVYPLIDYLGFRDIGSLIAKIEDLNNQYILPNISISDKIDLQTFAERSMQLQGAIKNSPVNWSKEYSMQIYNEIFESTRLI
jgi:alcohol dehydrogenase class IV